MPTITVLVDPRAPSAPPACVACQSPWLRPEDLTGTAWSCLLCGTVTIKRGPTRTER